jgi:hypothetical protein
MSRRNSRAPGARNRASGNWPFIRTGEANLGRECVSRQGLAPAG